MARTGIYCMSNDAFADWTIAFLQSFRRYNPSTELVMIPFDDRIDRIAALAPRYDFTLFEDDPLLKRLDGVGEVLFPAEHLGQKLFRKFATFNGPLDRFLYLDADIVVLSAVEEWIRRIVTHGADFTFFDRSPGWVYADPDFAAYMKREFNAQLFSAGAFVSRKDFIGLDEVEAVIPQSAWLKLVLPRGVYDQPYLNYIVDTKRSKVAASYDVIPELCHTAWAAPNVDIGPEQLKALGDSAVTRNGKILPFLHWAGFECEPFVPNIGFFLHFRLSAEPSWARRMLWRRRFHAKWTTGPH